MNFEAGIRSAIGLGLGFQHLPATAGKKRRKCEKNGDFGRWCLGMVLPSDCDRLGSVCHPFLDTVLHRFLKKHLFFVILQIIILEIIILIWYNINKISYPILEVIVMARFIDRESEMKTLENEYARPGSSLVILYGRRRVGKTSLISEFIRNKNALFFLASEEPEVQNRNAFREKAADFIRNDLLRDASGSSWDVIFKTIIDTPFEQKPIIVMDEFQYIGKSNPAFPSIFSGFGKNS